MKIFTYLILILIALAAMATYAYLNEINSPPVAIIAICPTHYPDTEAGREEYNIATDDWVKRYLEANPFASLEEVDSARQKSWEEMGCNATTTTSVTIADADLLPCQIYYRDVFMQAKEYGQFQDFPATTTYTGPIATLDEDSHPVAKRFYSYHKAALDSGEVDFGGKYAISDWALTGWGQMFAVVDLEIGKVFPFPYAFHESFDYRPDSNLIVINPKHLMPKFDTFGPNSDVFCDTWVYEDIKSYYFVFENEQFKLLGPADITKLSQPGVLD